MNLYVLRWNPKISSYKNDEHKKIVERITKGHTPFKFNWSVHEWQELKKDDLFIVQRVGTKNDGITMIGKFRDKCYQDESWIKDDETLMYYADLWIMDAFDCDVQNPLSAAIYEKHFPQIEWHSGHSGILLDQKTGQELLKTIETDLIQAGIWKENYLKDFMAYDFEAAAKMYLGKKPTPKELENGNKLIKLKKAYLAEGSEQNLVNLMFCLHYSNVYVPVIVETGKTAFDNIIYHPITFDGEFNNVGFPVFSNKKQAGTHFEENPNISLIKIPMVECIKKARHIENCDAIILDYYEDHMNIPFTILDIIEEMEYKE